MSSLLLKKVVPILIFLMAGTGQVVGQSIQDSLESAADREFLYGNYLSAVQLYGELIESGRSDEITFYRLAYLHEQLKEYPASIYYLRKLYWKTGDPLIRDKISTILEQPDRSIPEGDPATSLTILTLRYKWWIIGGVILLLLAATGLMFSKWKHRGKGAIWISAIAALIALFLAGNWQLSSPRAVIVLPTYFYNSPSYGAERLSLPIAAGSTVILLEEQDIWQEIEANGARAWVPAFVLSAMEEWD